MPYPSIEHAAQRSIALHLKEQAETVANVGLDTHEPAKSVEADDITGLDAGRELGLILAHSLFLPCPMHLVYIALVYSQAEKFRYSLNYPLDNRLEAL